MKHGNLGFALAIALLVYLAAGCGQAIDLKYKYQVGQADKIQYSTVRTYKNWIEMEDKKPQGISLRKNTENLILRREIQSVDAEGNALMKVVIEQADVELELSMPDMEKIQRYYRSGPGGTETMWGGLPPLAGVEYTLKIAPDTTILEIQGLDEIRQAFASVESNELVDSLLEDNTIRNVHQRDFMRGAPTPVQAGKSYELAVVNPDPMVKAEAVKRIFTADPVETGKGESILTVRSVSEPLMVRPEGISAPPQPRDFGALLKDASEMQELKYDGSSAFDLQTHCVLKDEIKMFCYLVMMEETFFGGIEKYGKTPEELSVPNTNAMLTEVTFESTYKKLE